MRREWTICVLLAALTLCAYWPVRNCEFIYYDDPQFITENPQVSAGLSWSGLAYAFTQPVAGNWHPVTTLSHMLDCELFGLNPGAHHLVNAVLHALNALLLFIALRALTGATWRSAIVAGLFGLHPLRVESVAWIAERKDVLSGSFFLLTLWAWGRAHRARKAPSQAEQGRPLTFRRFYWLSLLFCALGLMSKPMLVTLPFVLLLLDVWPLGRCLRFTWAELRSLLREKIPFFVLAAICSVITLQVQRSAGAMSFFRQLTLPERLANAGESYVRYLGKLVWPTKLAIVYPHPARGYCLNEAWPAWMIVAALLLLVLFTVFCLARLRGQPYLAVGWLWFLGTLVPVIGLVQVGEQSMANRYTYLPLIGPVIALVWTAHELAGHLKKGQRPGADATTARTIAVCVLACLSLAGLWWLTRLQLGHWRNTVSLFDYAVAVTPDNPSAHFALGVGLEKERRIGPAITEYRVAVAIDPGYSKANYNLGQLFYKAGDIQSATARFGAALQSNPNDFTTRLNFANSLQQLGRIGEARAQYEECLRRQPESTEALNNLAWLLATEPDPRQRDGRRAVDLAERAVNLSQGKYPVMIGTLAAAYAEAGRFAEAAATAQRAAAAASEQGQSEVATRNLQLLELYRSGQPYHESRR